MLSHLGSWDELLPWAKFTYNNSHHVSIGMTPYEALYFRRYITHLCWYKDGELVLIRIEILQHTTKKVKKNTRKDNGLSKLAEILC